MYRTGEIHTEAVSVHLCSHGTDAKIRRAQQQKKTQACRLAVPVLPYMLCECAHPVAGVVAERTNPRMFLSALDEIQHRLAPPVGDEPLRGRRALRALRRHQLHETARVRRGRWIHYVLHQVIQVERILSIRHAVPVQPPRQHAGGSRVPLDESFDREQLVQLDSAPRWIRDRRAFRPEAAEVQPQRVGALVVSGWSSIATENRIAHPA